LGVEGCTIRVQNTAQLAKFDIDASTDADVDNFKLYGTTFLDADSISFPANATNVEILSCSFESCGEILPDTAAVQYCNFIKANDRGLRIASASHNVEDCTFVTCEHSVHVNVSTTIPFSGMNFYGGDGVTYYDIEHSVAGALIINSTDSVSPASYVEETGGGSTTINNTVKLTINTVDKNNDPVANVSCAIYKTSDDTQLMNEDSSALGVAEEDFNYATPIDIYWRVRESPAAGSRYKPESGIGQISATGFEVTVVMEPETV